MKVPHELSSVKNRKTFKYRMNQFSYSGNGRFAYYLFSFAEE